MGKTKVINLFGGPGSGKSTLASLLFGNMKLRGYKVEYVTEFAKDLTYSKRSKCLSNQVFVTGNQYHRMVNVSDDVDYIITDSPLLLGKVYGKLVSIKHDSYYNLVDDINSEFENYNFFIQRPNIYQGFGRSQSLDEAENIDKLICNTVDATVLDNKNTPEERINQILSYF